MTLSGYFISNSVLVPAVLDFEGSTFKDGCVKSRPNQHRPIRLSAKIYAHKGTVCEDMRRLKTLQSFHSTDFGLCQNLFIRRCNPWMEHTCRKT